MPVIVSNSQLGLLYILVKLLLKPEYVGLKSTVYLIYF